MINSMTHVMYNLVSTKDLSSTDEKTRATCLIVGLEQKSEDNTL